MTRRLLIYDCDNTMGLRRQEIDDGLTLLYLLGRPDIELLGVTTTFGNGPIDAVYNQTTQLLRERQRPDLPVYKGAGQRNQPPTAAAAFLAETAAAHPGQITLLATGPLGNLRAAALLDPNFFANLRQIVCMGGYLHPLRIGWRSMPELNLAADPEASLAVLRAPYPVTLMHAHVCLQATFGWGDLLRAGYWDRATRRIVRNWLLAFSLYHGVPVFYLWDLLPAVYVSHPELFDHNPTGIRSTAAYLESGTLITTVASAQSSINMPSRIRDRRRFKQTLAAAWERERSISFT